MRRFLSAQRVNVISEAQIPVYIPPKKVLKAYA